MRYRYGKNPEPGRVIRNLHRNCCEACIGCSHTCEHKRMVVFLPARTLDPLATSLIHSGFRQVWRKPEVVKMVSRVVNVRKEECDVYIGRGSKWGNRFLALRNNLWARIRLFLTRQNSPGPQRAKLPPACPNLALCPNCFAENNRVNFSRTQIRRTWLATYAFVV